MSTCPISPCRRGAQALDTEGSLSETGWQTIVYRIFFLVGGLLMLFGVDAYAQRTTGTIQGFVSDRENGEPMELVTIRLGTLTDPLVRGAVTNRDGVYLFPQLAPGTYIIRASFVGYVSMTDTLTINAGDTRTFNLALSPGDEVMEEVLVEEENPSGNTRLIAGQQTLTPEEINLIPSPDLSGDLINMLSSLPGVVSLGDRGGQYFVRGGEPSQNMVLLDGILLYQPFHILGFYSAFPSEIISRTDVYAGGFSSKYGERLSSVIDVNTRNGNAQRLSGSVALSPFVTALRAEGPLVRDRVSLLASFRQSLVEEGGERLVGTPLPFNFGDAFVKLHAKIKDNTRFSATAIHTYDRGELGVESFVRPPDEVRWQNSAIGGRLLTIPSLTPVVLDMRASYSYLETSLGPSSNPDRTSSISSLHFTTDATLFGPVADIEMGVSARLISLKSELGGLYQNIEVRKESIEHVAVYAEPEFSVGERLKIRPGLRIQFFDVRFNPYLEPRLRVVYETPTQQFSMAAGLYNQAILGLNDRRDAASVFTVWTNIPKPSTQVTDIREGLAQSAFHATLGYRRSILANIDVSVEGYFKRMSNLFLAEWTAFPQFTTSLQPGSGNVIGFDARVEARHKAFYGYINYGYARTRYEAEQASILLWYGEPTLSFNPPHDRRHQLSALLSGSVKGFDMSMRWTFGSGLPFSQAAGFDGFVLIGDVIDVLDAQSSRRVIYEEPFNARLPTYHRLDLSVERVFSFDNVDLTVQGSIINVYDRRNLFYLDVFTLQRVDQLPFFPSFGLKVNI